MVLRCTVGFIVVLSRGTGLRKCTGVCGRTGACCRGGGGLGFGACGSVEEEERGGGAAGGLGVVGGLEDGAEARVGEDTGLGLEQVCALVEHGAEQGEELLDVGRGVPLGDLWEFDVVVRADVHELPVAVAPGVEECVVAFGEVELHGVSSGGRTGVREERAGPSTSTGDDRVCARGRGHFSTETQRCGGG